jgi:alpha-tubulin suppressor-like RCC1 family protein
VAASDGDGGATGGDARNDDAGVVDSADVVVPRGAVEIAAAGDNACARMGDGTVRCWGDNQQGQIGDGTTDRRARPTIVDGVTTAVEITVGSAHTCARLTNGSVRCWGWNALGQLGDGTTDNRSRAVMVLGLTDVQQLAAGLQHTCALLANRTVTCWGGNTYGQLGDGTLISRTSPTLVPSLSGVAEIAAGAAHTCARVAADGTVRCWGLNIGGQLGTTPNMTNPDPVAVPNVRGADRLAAGRAQTCARTMGDRSLRCWGATGAGSGSTTMPISGLDAVQAFDAGDEAGCAAASGNAALYCWGSNDYGQLGDGTMMNRTSPTLVGGLTLVSQVAMGGAHTCALLMIEGAVRCWGDNRNGQLGDGTTTSRPMAAPVVW